MLTQGFLSEMLGARRTSVNEVAIKIQAAGWRYQLFPGGHQGRRSRCAQGNVLRML
jgi:hypothetical protein